MQLCPLGISHSSFLKDQMPGLKDRIKQASKPPAWKRFVVGTRRVERANGRSHSSGRLHRNAVLQLVDR
jgi:hypothetical protein